MRLLTYDKLYRAYPELDQYDDAVCIEYLHRAVHQRGAWRGWVQGGLAFVLGGAVWASIYWLGTLAWPTLDARYKLEKSDFAVILIAMLSVIGTVGIPAISALYARDRWLKRRFHDLLNNVRCGECRYSLIGLALLEEDPPCVQCPECGTVLNLAAMGLTAEDIDPTLLQESP